MMAGKCVLNNMTLENIRKTQGYQAMMIDLAIEGVIAVDTAERLLGYKIPDYLRAPDGRDVSLLREAPQGDIPADKKSKRRSE